MKIPCLSSHKSVTTIHQNDFFKSIDIFTVRAPLMRTCIVKFELPILVILKFCNIVISGSRQCKILPSQTFTAENQARFPDLSRKLILLRHYYSDFFTSECHCQQPGIRRKARVTYY